MPPPTRLPPRFWVTFYLRQPFALDNGFVEAMRIVVSSIPKFMSSVRLWYGNGFAVGVHHSRGERRRSANQVRQVDPTMIARNPSCTMAAAWRMSSCGGNMAGANALHQMKTARVSTPMLALTSVLRQNRPSPHAVRSRTGRMIGTPSIKTRDVGRNHESFTTMRFLRLWDWSKIYPR